LRNLPEIFSIESTNYCNLKCIMCPRGEPDIMRRPLGHMDTALFAKILAETAFFSDPCWFHLFGEPLMNPHLFEQIELAKKRIPNLGISTNATLLDGENTAALLDSGIDTIMISIDGASAEVYEQVRKSSSFSYAEVAGNAEKFLAVKREKRARKPYVILSIIRMEETEKDLEAFRAHWLSQGADEVKIKPFGTWGSQTEDFTALASSFERSKFASPRLHPCKHLWESVVITWDGRVVPCCYDYDAKMVMGDLKSSTLAEIWNSPAYVELRRAELAGRNDSPLCSNCTEAPGHARDPGWGGTDPERGRDLPFSAHRFWPRLFRERGSSRNSLS
jgi:radical SAM protein with 4Fe4S-binding SPASM domain